MICGIHTMLKISAVAYSSTPSNQENALKNISRFFSNFSHTFEFSEKHEFFSVQEQCSSVELDVAGV